jgi:hypothetical protein
MYLFSPVVGIVLALVGVGTPPVAGWTAAQPR